MYVFFYIRLSPICLFFVAPQETLQLALTVRMDETCPAVDTLNLIVSEGDDLTVQLRCKGGANASDTPVICEEDENG